MSMVEVDMTDVVMSAVMQQSSLPQSVDVVPGAYRRYQQNCSHLMWLAWRACNSARISHPKSGHDLNGAVSVDSRLERWQRLGVAHLANQGKVGELGAPLALDLASLQIERSIVGWAHNATTSNLALEHGGLRKQEAQPRGKTEHPEHGQLVRFPHLADQGQAQVRALVGHREHLVVQARQQHLLTADLDHQLAAGVLERGCGAGSGRAVSAARVSVPGHRDRSIQVADSQSRASGAMTASIAANYACIVHIQPLLQPSRRDAA
eukprot:359869-Chlamydomonas_euryale.AAC.8